MNCVKSCTACLYFGHVCDGNPEGCLPCLRNAFICTKDFRDCPIVPQPRWRDEDLAGSPSAIISPAQIAHDHAGLIQSLNDFYQVLVDMQYLQDDDIIRPPHVTLPALVEEVYTPETVALLRQLPHLRTCSLEITPSETQPFPYLNLDELDTLSGHNNPRDPLDHYPEEDWTIPPWTFFVSWPAPRNRGWSFLLDARPPEDVIGEWISAFRCLRWVPSLLREEWKIHEVPASLGRGNPSRWEKDENNIYWALRVVYEECGWPDQLRPEELTRRRMELNELVRRSSWSADEWSAYYHRAAGDHAI